MVFKPREFMTMLASATAGLMDPGHFNGDNTADALIGGCLRLCLVPGHIHPHYRHGKRPAA